MTARRSRAPCLSPSLPVWRGAGAAGERAQSLPGGGRAGGSGRGGDGRRGQGRRCSPQGRREAAPSRGPPPWPDWKRPRCQPPPPRETGGSGERSRRPAGSLSPPRPAERRVPPLL